MDYLNLQALFFVSIVKLLFTLSLISFAYRTSLKLVSSFLAFSLSLKLDRRTDELNFNFFLI